jgi:hypothetical protein
MVRSTAILVIHTSLPNGPWIATLRMTVLFDVLDEIAQFFHLSVFCQVIRGKTIYIMTHL